MKRLLEKWFFLKSLVQLGTGGENTKQEDKKVRFLNFYVLVWEIVVIVSTFDNYYRDVINVPEQSILFGSFLFCVLIQFLQSNRRYVSARLVVLVMSYVFVFSYANFILPGTLMEYFTLFPLILMIVLFESRWLYFSALGVATCLFFFPNFYVEHYPISLFNQLHNLIFFIAVFLGFYFFNNQNRKSERSLEEQRNEALAQKEVIEIQKAELEELNRFQSKFFVNISHELRTPLTLIQGYASQLNTTEQSTSVRNILDQSGKMADMVDDILDMSKAKFQKLELQLTTVNLNELVHRLYVSFLPSFEAKGVTLSFDAPQYDCFVQTDLRYMERALNNVLHNSLKFTPAEQWVKLSLKCTDDQVELVVADGGIGISAEDLPQVFDRFYQASNDINQSGGSGVGLSFTKDIIELCDGKVSIDSALGKGTTVHISLPLKKVDSAQTVEYQAPMASGSKVSEVATQASNDIKVLVVDDHDEMRAYIVSLLSGVEVLQAVNGQEALKLLKKEQVDYIITDYMMPVMDGLQLVEAIRAQELDIPILMLTARVDFEGKMKVLRLGVDDYLTKPFQAEELLVRMNRSLENYQQRKKFQAEEKNIEEPEEVESTGDPLLEKIQEFILQNVGDASLSLGEICDEFGLSTSSLYRRVKSSTGLSSNEFVREVKLQRALELVDEGRCQTVKELSLSVGFSKPSYFVQLYEKRFGKKPEVNRF